MDRELRTPGRPLQVSQEPETPERQERSRAVTLESATSSQEMWVRIIAGLALAVVGEWYFWDNFGRFWSVLESRETLTFILGAVLVIPLAAAIAASLHILPQYERGVVLFLGRHFRWYPFPYPFSLYKGIIPTPFFFKGNRGPGLTFTIPLFETMIRVDTRDELTRFSAAQTQTRDQAPIDAEGGQIWSIDPDEPHPSVLSGRNVYDLVKGSTDLVAKSALGQFDLDTAISDKRRITASMREYIEPLMERWGLLTHEISLSDVRITLPEVQASIAQALEAKYTAGAKVEVAQREFQVAQLNDQAAKIYQANPHAWRVRQLQAFEVAAEKAKAIIMPSEALASMGSLGTVMSLDTALGPDQE